MRNPQPAYDALVRKLAEGVPLSTAQAWMASAMRPDGGARVFFPHPRHRMALRAVCVRQEGSERVRR